MKKRRTNWALAHKGNKPEDLEYTRAREDLAKIIAQETSGYFGALADPDDYELADEFIKRINSRYEETT